MLRKVGNEAVIENMLSWYHKGPRFLPLTIGACFFNRIVGLPVVNAKNH